MWAALDGRSKFFLGDDGQTKHTDKYARKKTRIISAGSFGITCVRRLNIG